MIEICTVKRMSLTILTLTSITIFIVIYVKFLSDTEANLEMAFSQNKSEDKCWLWEEFKVKEKCKPCNSFEKKASLPYCHTGFKEFVTCIHHGDTWKSCDRVPWLERRNFWFFEGATFCLGSLSALAMYARKKHNDQRTFERIQKQIAAGV